MLKQILLAGLVLLATSPVFAKPVEPGKLIGSTEVIIPSWFKESFLDFREDAKESAENDKHLLLFFHAEGCPYCQKMLDDNFRGENTSLIQTSFDSIDIHMGGGREIEFDNETSVTESELTKVLQVHFTPTLLFMNADNKVVARVNGYRSPREFKQVLNFVKEKAYLVTDLAHYRQDHLKDAVYKPVDDKNYVKTNNLATLVKEDKPLMVLFEDKTCDECERFHKEVMDLDKTKTLLQKFNVVYFDALSDQKIINPDGHKTTPKEWINKMNISYRPAILFYSEGRKIEQLAGMIKSYHFQQLLSFVEQKKYTTHDNWADYMMKQSKILLKEGKDVDIWK